MSWSGRANPRPPTCFNRYATTTERPASRAVPSRLPSAWPIRSPWMPLHQIPPSADAGGDEASLVRASLSDVLSWVWDCCSLERLETAMYMVIRKFNRVRSVAEAARRAESGIGQLLKHSPGFQGYYVFDAGDGVGGSVTLFDS